MFQPYATLNPSIVHIVRIYIFIHSVHPFHKRCCWILHYVVFFFSKKKRYQTVTPHQRETITRRASSGEDQLRLCADRSINFTSSAIVATSYTQSSWIIVFFFQSPFMRRRYSGGENAIYVYGDCASCEILPSICSGRSAALARGHGNNDSISLC